jgi:hypothetical protein
VCFARFPFLWRGTPGFIVTFLVMLCGDSCEEADWGAIETELWEAYRELCRRQRLRPSQPMEDFLRLVVDEGSAVGLLWLMWEAAKARVEWHEAYARVLLDWYTPGKFLIDSSEDEELPVETLLLEALKTVADP